MSGRELIVLGTGSRAPTRDRNVNSYLLRWDGAAVLIDPGEGTQQQLRRAHIAATEITDIFISHLHGDHCLGLPGVLEQLALEKAEEVAIHFPASGAELVRRLCDADIGARALVRLDPVPVPVDGTVLIESNVPLRVRAAPLRHPVDTLGYRFEDVARRHLIPDLLQRAGIHGPMVSELEHHGAIEVGGARYTYGALSERRPGASFVTLLDTARCDAAIDLARHADLLLCEATFLDAESHLAEEHGHLTARQAGVIAREADARMLVLSHYSSRYPNLEGHYNEASAAFNNVVCAEDLTVIKVPTGHRERSAVHS